MRPAFVATILLIFAGGAVFGQSPGELPAFEVASIKPSAPLSLNGQRAPRLGMSGGPETKDPDRFTCDYCSLSMLVMAAYDIKRYQLTAPGWFTTERFDITAKVPEGATKEQLKQMLQNLLAERFHMKIHRETKEMPVYELVVAKGGPKMTEAVEQPAAKSPAGDGAEAAPPPVAAPTRLTMGPDGCPLFPGSRAPSMMVRFAAKACLQASGETMEGFAATLANYLSKPVTDGTGLKGKYEFRLGWATDLAMERTAVPVGVGSPVSATPGQPGGSGTPPMSSSDGDSGPSLFGAVQKLGLKLEQKKGSVEMIVVDSADKAPTEN